MKKQSIIILCIFIFIAGLVIGIRVMYDWGMQKIIDQRAKELNIMRYDSQVDKMVPKDSLHLDNWDFHYLKYGTMK